MGGVRIGRWIRQSLRLLLTSALVASGLLFVSPTAALASGCDSSEVDLSLANRVKVATLKGVNARKAKQIVTRRKQGLLNELADLRDIELSDRRFLALVKDKRTCIAGRRGSELLPGRTCEDDDARINSGNTRSLARRIGLRNARILVEARPIKNLRAISKIPNGGPSLLSLLARSGGTCLDRIDHPVAPPEPPPGTEPETSMSDGTFAIGTDIVSGRYLASGVVDCIWSRRSGGATLAEVANVEAEQLIVDIATTDATFESRGCGTWRLIDDVELSPVVDIPGDGDWLVNTQLTPGIYRASDQAECRWARHSGFSGETTDTIDDDLLPSTRTLIEVLATDVGFASSGCGSWQLVPTECLNQLEAVHPEVPEDRPHIYGVSDSVLLSTRWEMEMVMTDFSFHWGGFGGLNTRDAPPIVEVEIGEGKVTGTTAFVGLGHNYRGFMLDDFPGYIDSIIETFPDHVDRVIWVAPSRFNSSMPLVVTMLNEATERWPQMEIADFWVEGDAQNNPEWFEDGLHHDAVGRKEIAKYLNDKLLHPCS